MTWFEDLSDVNPAKTTLVEEERLTCKALSTRSVEIVFGLPTLELKPQREKKTCSGF
jgi:hypothetical protein